MEASHEEKKKIHTRFSPNCVESKKAKKKKKPRRKQQASSAGELPGATRPWLVARQRDSVICFGACFVELGPSRVSPSGQEEEELK